MSKKIDENTKLVIKKVEGEEEKYLIGFVLKKEDDGNKDLTQNLAQNSIQKSESKKTYRFIATSEVVDRVGDIMRIKGAHLENYLKNPVVLFAHKKDAKPVGKVVNIEIANDKIYVDIEFAETEKGEEVEYLVREGYLNTVSIGFLPKAIIYKNDFEVIAELDPDFYARHEKDLINADRVIWEWELLEISVVPVPANPEAIAVLKAYGIEIAKEIKKEYIEKDGKIIEVKELIDLDLSDYDVKAVPTKHPANMKYDDKSPWDKNIAIATLRKWASKDGSGRKETIDFNKYKMGFGWYDAKKPKELTSYKFPHHWVKNGDFYCVWSGVRTAMAFLIRLHSTGRLTIPEVDAKKLYKHLVKHYKEFGKEPPEFKQMSIIEAIEFDEEFGKVFLEDATPEELLDIAKNLINTKKELEQVKAQLEAYEKQIVELKNKIEQLNKKEENKLEDFENLNTSEKINSKQNEFCDKFQKSSNYLDSNEVEAHINQIVASMSDKIYLNPEDIKDLTEILIKKLKEEFDN